MSCVLLILVHIVNIYFALVSSTHEIVNVNINIAKDAVLIFSGVLVILFIHRGYLRVFRVFDIFMIV